MCSGEFKRRDTSKKYVAYKYEPCTHPGVVFEVDVTGRRWRWLCGIHKSHNGGRWQDIVLSELTPQELITVHSRLSSYIENCRFQISEWQADLAETQILLDKVSTCGQP
jgi:hypothetical protein